MPSAVLRELQTYIGGSEDMHVFREFNGWLVPKNRVAKYGIFLPLCTYGNGSVSMGKEETREKGGIDHLGGKRGNGWDLSYGIIL